MPVSSEKEVIGIAEALSPDLRNFEGGDVLVMSFLTDLIASLAAPRPEIEEPDYRDLITMSEPQEDIAPQTPVQQISSAAILAAPVMVVAPEVANLSKPTFLAQEKPRRVQKATPILLTPTEWPSRRGAMILFSLT